MVSRTVETGLLPLNLASRSPRPTAKGAQKARWTPTSEKAAWPETELLRRLSPERGSAGPRSRAIRSGGGWRNAR